jgi:hypothetical protein
MLEKSAFTCQTSAETDLLSMELMYLGGYMDDGFHASEIVVDGEFEFASCLMRLRGQRALVRRAVSLSQALQRVLMWIV